MTLPSAADGNIGELARSRPSGLGAAVQRARLSSWALACVTILIACLAALLRFQSCRESFWVDELHTAWTVWGEWSDVAPRASWGHQTPLYFYGVWGWKQVVGSSEGALRSSSLFAISLASGVLCWGLTRQLRRLTPGVIAGVILAVDQHSLFFGTELRPYAWVVAFAAIAVCCFVSLYHESSRQAGIWRWSALIVSVLIAGLLQPTSLGVLGFLPATLLVVWTFRHRSACRTLGLHDVVLLGLVLLVGIGLWRATVREAVEQRADWATFASTNSLQDLALMWDWGSLLVVPLLLVAFAVAARRLGWMSKPVPIRDPSLAPVARQASRMVICLAGIAIGSTTFYWLIAYFEWLPVWHRRYLIALLPLLAAIPGIAVTAATDGFAHSARRSMLSAALGIALIATLSWEQATWRSFPQPIVQRGEHWREAVAWIRDSMGPHDRVFVHAGLIEAKNYLADRSLSERPADADRLIYLCYPLLGPYQLDTAAPPQPITPERLSRREDLARSPTTLYVISRQPRWQWERAWKRWIPSSLRQELQDRITVKGFGGVSVMRLDPPLTKQTPS